MAIMDYLKPLLGVTGGAAGGMLGPIGSALGSAAGSAIGGYFGGSSGQNNNMQNYQGQIQNYPGQNPSGQDYGPNSSQELTGGTTAIRMPQFTQDQAGALNQMVQQGLSGMQNLPQANFGPIAEQYKTQFQQQTIPSIMERFTSMGAGGQRSSAFEQALGSAGAGLNQNLAGMEQGFNMQNRGQDISRLMGMLQMGLQPQSQTHFVPPEQSFMSSIGGGLGSGIGAIAPMLAQMLMSRYLGGQQAQ